MMEKQSQSLPAKMCLELDTNCIQIQETQTNQGILRQGTQTKQDIPRQRMQTKAGILRQGRPTSTRFLAHK